MRSSTCSQSKRLRPSPFEVEVIDRLYVLNAERAREEQRLGLARPAKGAKGEAEDGGGGDEVGEQAAANKKATAKKTGGKKTSGDQKDLF